jgi:hypothetical protein
VAVAAAAAVTVDVLWEAQDRTLSKRVNEKNSNKDAETTGNSALHKERKMQLLLLCHWR